MELPRPPTPKHNQIIKLPPVNQESIDSVPSMANVETGPDEYPAHRNASLIFGVLFIMTLLSKCALVWVECQTIWDSFKTITTCIYFVAIFNLYLLYMIKYKSYMTQARFKNPIVSPFTYWYLLNYVVYLGIPVLGYFQYHREMLLEVIIGCVICVLDSSAFLLAVAYPIREHKPLKKADRYILVDTTQYSHEVEKALHIVESNSFKIMITNSGQVPVDGPVTIRRTIVSKPDRVTPCDRKDTENVLFSMDLEGQLQPKGELIFIPETHAMEGAIKVKNFRSFGNNRGIRVQTEVILGKRGKISHVKEVSIYKFV